MHAERIEKQIPLSSFTVEVILSGHRSLGEIHSEIVYIMTAAQNMRTKIMRITIRVRAHLSLQQGQEQQRLVVLSSDVTAVVARMGIFSALAILDSRTEAL
jgi:hypothetical protein